jgi:hypothetical protein
MANTFTLISSSTLGSTASSVTFSSIPSTYTDLFLRASARTNYAALSNMGQFYFNGDTTNKYSTDYIESNGSSLSGGRSVNTSQFNIMYINGDSNTANAFGPWSIYIPNYQSSGIKQLFAESSSDGTNSTQTKDLVALRFNSGAVSSITLYSGGVLWAADSSFHLYGIKNS